MKIYRFENTVTEHGMWYQSNGVFDPFIFKLTDGISKDLPMEHHERYSKDGFRWFSGCSSLEQLKMWFSEQDMLELRRNGYGLYEFKSEQYVIEDGQILFTREGILDKSEI